MANASSSSSSSFRFILFCCLMIISSILQFSEEAADLLRRGAFIRDGETLVSEDQTFELGFFSPGQSRNRYVGIWYKKSPEAVVWVANRDNPVTDSTGVLTVNDNGNLVIVNQTYFLFWSALPNMSAPFPENPVAHLLNSGNLFLHNNNNNTMLDPVPVPDPNPTDPNFLWQSFDFPTDTLLQGTKVRLNLKNGKDRYLISWKSPDDPSVGNFSFRLRINGLPQLYIERKSETIYRTGPWNGIGFGAIPAVAMTVFKPMVVISENESYFSYKTIIDFLGMRLRLNPSGSLQYLIMKPNATEQWTVFHSLPVDKCDRYGLCGANTICSTQGNNTCECMPGFVPKSYEENVTDIVDNSFPMNCVREFSLKCNGDLFQKLAEVKAPDLLNIKLINGIQLQECQAECLKDCSCTAYANMNISDGGSSCVMWFGDLMDMREISGDNRREEIYIRLPDSNQGSKKITAIISGIGGLVLVIIILGSVLCFFIFRKKSKKNKDGSLCLVKLEGGKGETEVPLFTMSTIKKATNHFSRDNIIGSGGFGHVYKGSLNGQEIAVKRLSKNSTQGAEQFSNEVVSIAQLQHRNLVGLLGCCIEGDERMLIYEFMPNKSLDSFIFASDRKAELTWQKRLEIVQGIARGLLYLHQDAKLQIIHRDLKAANILLDGNLNPKISDFGLARLFDSDVEEIETERLIGTRGYMAPEYTLEGKFSVKSDVFAFGVLILEIVSGKKNQGQGCKFPSHHQNLLGHTWFLWSEDRVLELLDSCLLEASCDQSEVVRLIQIGLLCAQEQPEDRPTMSLVLCMLTNKETSLAQPKQPGCFIERNSSIKM